MQLTYEERTTDSNCKGNCFPMCFSWIYYNTVTVYESDLKKRRNGMVVNNEMNKVYFYENAILIISVNDVGVKHISWIFASIVIDIKLNNDLFKNDSV